MIVIAVEAVGQSKASHRVVDRTCIDPYKLLSVQFIPVLMRRALRDILLHLDDVQMF